MRAYKPPLEERSNFEGLCLDFNERLAPLPERVITAIKNFSPNRCRKYPSYGALESKISKYSKVESENVIITNGSDQGIELVFRTFVNAGDEVLIPSPSFAMFYQAAAIQGANIIKPEYKNGNFPLKEVLSLNPKLLIICNPNNPTGSIISIEEIQNILKTMNNTVVLIDEAYFEFSRVTAAPLIKKYSNLIITRTFSKAFGLAALRIGYLMANPKTIKELLKVRGPYDINQIAKIAAEAALDSNTTAYCSEVMNRAKPLVEAYFCKQQIKFWPSASNFIYFKLPCKSFVDDLKENGVLIREQKNGYGRVTIGPIKQMEKFIQIFDSLTSKS